MKRLEPSYFSAMLGVFLKLVSRLPLSGLRSTGAWFGGLAYDLFPRYRRKILANTERIGLPLALARESSRHTGMLAGETAWIWGRSNQDIASRVEFDPASLTRFKELLAAGRSIVLMTPHVGGFEAIPAALYEVALKPFHKSITVLYREPKSHWVRPFVRLSRTREGVDPAPADLGGVRRIVRAMRSGGILGCLPDQVPGRGEGVWVPFFGRLAFTMTFPMKMAHQFDAVCVIVSCLRRKDAGWKIYMETMPEPATGDAQCDATHMNEAIERAVMRSPEQYLWNYNRYKGTPQVKRNEACGEAGAS